MRGVTLLVTLVVGLGFLILWARKGGDVPHAEVWSQEPKVYLGVKIGQPLDASIPRCQPDDKRLCFDGAFISEPDPLSATYPIIQDGIVTEVITNYRASAEDLIRQDLKQKYGEPQSSFAGTETWEGQVISITLTSPGKNDVGFLTAALIHPPKTNEESHKNPF